MEIGTMFQLIGGGMFIASLVALVWHLCLKDIREAHGVLKVICSLLAIGWLLHGGGTLMVTPPLTFTFFGICAFVLVALIVMIHYTIAAQRHQDNIRKLEEEMRRLQEQQINLIHKRAELLDQIQAALERREKALDQTREALEEKEGFLNIMEDRLLQRIGIEIRNGPDPLPEDGEDGTM